jgi:hypothetical protein
MTTLTFDTHDIIKRFRDKGLSEDLAELQVEAIKEVVKQAVGQVQNDYRLDDLVTNKDLDLRIKETELKKETVKSELIRWVVAVGVLQTTIITALLIKLIAGL